jgi:hypothetical protein
MATAEPDSDIGHCDENMPEKYTNATHFSFLTVGRLVLRAL